ncbi:MAG TPA: pyridoxamine 5'-phosphate oxidase family protein, partial [Tepidisphaeraceae bacterium]|nr:pyridoxamine 5'-phosphate oxidase family protein [Tepidisphaeraceae bacterium]
MQWLDELGNSLRREFGHSPRLMVLATVDRSGSPHARVVVCRRIDEEGRLYVATDARSEKAGQ